MVAQVGLLTLAVLVGCKDNQAKASKNLSASPGTKAAPAAPSTPQAGAQDPKTLYKIKNKAIQLGKAKKSGKASFDIKLVKGAKVHPKAPFQCQLSASAGLTLSKKSLGHGDKKISKDKKTKLVTVNVGTAVKVQAKGNQNVTMDCAFFVCTKDLCMRTTEKVTIASNIK